MRMKDYNPGAAINPRFDKISHAASDGPELRNLTVNRVISPDDFFQNASRRYPSALGKNNVSELFSDVTPRALVIPLEFFSLGLPFETGTSCIARGWRDRRLSREMIKHATRDPIQLSFTRP